MSSQTQETDESFLFLKRWTFHSLSRVERILEIKMMKLIDCMSTRISIESHLQESLCFRQDSWILFASRESTSCRCYWIIKRTFNRQSYKSFFLSILMYSFFHLLIWCNWMPGENIVCFACMILSLVLYHSLRSISARILFVFEHTLCSLKKKIVKEEEVVEEEILEQETETSSFASLGFFSSSSRSFPHRHHFLFYGPRGKALRREREVVKKMSTESLFKAFTGGRTFLARRRNLRRGQRWLLESQGRRLLCLYIHVFLSVDSSSLSVQIFDVFMNRERERERTMK